MIVQISEEVAVLLKALREPELIVALERLHLLGHHRFHLAHVFILPVVASAFACNRGELAV